MSDFQIKGRVGVQQGAGQYQGGDGFHRSVMDGFGMGESLAKVRRDKA